MYGLGKHRSKYGRFIDENGITQEEVTKASKLNRETVSKACAEDDPIMRGITKQSLIAAVRELSGKDVTEEDFWERS